MRFWQQELGGSSLSSSESDSVMRWAGTLWGRERGMVFKPRGGHHDVAKGVAAGYMKGGGLELFCQEF